MELTPEEKQKIYEEEKERLAAQEKVKKEQQQKNAKKVGIGCLGFIVVIIIISIIGSSHQSSNTASTSTDSPSTASSESTSKPDLEILQTSSISEGYNGYVTGTVRNNTNKQYKYVQVEINLYDKSGAQVGSTLANTNNLEPHGLWKFKAPIIEDNTAKYSVKNVTGY